MPHFLIEKIMKKEKIEITVIPFKGVAEIDTAVLGGHVLVGAISFSYSLLEARQMRLLLLMREGRSAEFPEVPILKDLGYVWEV